MVAIAAVFTFEAGLAGLVLALEPEQSEHFMWRLWRSFKLWAPAILVVTMLIVTNLLNNIDLLGIAMSETIQHWVQLVVLGGFIPFLALTTLHAAKDRWAFYQRQGSGARQRPLVAKHIRLQEITELIETGSPIDLDALAYKYGVVRSTIDRDYTAAAKAAREGF
jgi:hypothetical protein